MSGSTSPVRLLVITEFWAPASLAGAARNTERALRSLGTQVEPWVLTGDRDVGDQTPWTDLPRDRWTRRDDIRVAYGPWGHHTLSRVRSAIAEVDPAVIYLPSLFATPTLATLLLGVGRFRHLVVAPEGELQPGPMQQRGIRKRAVIAALRGSRAVRDVSWRVADEDEADTLADRMGQGVRVGIAPTLPDPSPTFHGRSPKMAGQAHLAHVATVTPKKGLRQALEVLQGVTGPVRLTVAGAVDDEREAVACRRLAATLPANITVDWRGPIEHGEVEQIFASADALVLPTRGENYGYVVHEALAQGCPVVISDRTPWNHLAEAGAGWVLPLADLEAWRRAVSEIIALDQLGADRFASCARHAAAQASATVDLDAWRRLLVPDGGSPP